MGIFCIRNKWDGVSWVMAHPVALSEIQVNSGTQILLYHGDFIPISLYNYVRHHATCAGNALPVCSEAQWRLSGKNTTDSPVAFWRWIVYHRITHPVWRLPLQRPYSCADTYLLVHQRIFTSSLLVVSLGLLAAERRWDCLHPRSA